MLTVTITCVAFSLLHAVQKIKKDNKNSRIRSRQNKIQANERPWPYKKMGRIENWVNQSKKMFKPFWHTMQSSHELDKQFNENIQTAIRKKR